MIVVWVPQGGLGNLVFQYQAMSRLCPDARRYIMPATVLGSAIALHSRCWTISIPLPVRARFVRYWGRLLDGLVKVGILGLVEPEIRTVDMGYVSETLNVVRTEGLLDIWVFRGFFQSRRYALPRPLLAAVHVQSARSRMAELPAGCKVAVHFRFGDYRDWPVFGKRGAVLPDSFYKDAMSLIAARVADPCFLVFSDDIESAKAALGGRPNVHFYRGGSAGEDLAAMALCDHAIISASTFAWWGGALIENDSKIVVAPKYWLGFKSGRWYPETMHDPELTYLEVDARTCCR